MDNEGMYKDFTEEEVIKALKQGNFSVQELDLLATDINHSASHTMYNPTTDNGTKYDHQVYERYVRLLQIVSSYKV